MNKLGLCLVVLVSMFFANVGFACCCTIFCNLQGYRHHHPHPGATSQDMDLENFESMDPATEQLDYKDNGDLEGYARFDDQNTCFVSRDKSETLCDENKDALGQKK
jgi:hypothetical protein